jgi:DNA repair exonuclease SbcCD ATPase subunit
MRIVKFSAENIKRLRAVTIEPDGNVVVLSGANGQGKSSVLDAIWMALGGTDKCPKVPIRTGESHAQVTLDLGEIVVKRTFRATGTTLTVTQADGTKVSSPQRLLDALVGKMTFDPMEFMRMKPAAQADALRALIGLDFAASDAKRLQLYNERTAVNRELKSIQARGEAINVPENAPDAEQSPTEILAQITTAETHNASIYSATANAKKCVEYHERAIADLQAAKEALLVAERAVADTGRHRDEANSYAAALAPIVDTAALRAKIAELDQLNAAARAKQQLAACYAEYGTKEAQTNALTAQIDEIDATKAAALTDAKFPVDGLSFSDGGAVTLNGLPLDQASSAEKLRVSVAIAMRMNPKLRVLRIIDGSLLDANSLRIIGEMAAADDYQVWIEMVDESGEVGVVIEDGMVKA